MPIAAWPRDQFKAIEVIRFTTVAQEGNRTRPFDSGGAGCKALHGLWCDQRQSILPVDDLARWRQSNSPVLLGWRGMPGASWNRRQSNSSVRLWWRRIPGTSWPWVRSKAIELVRSTRVARDQRRFMAFGAIELARSTRVAKETRCFMALRAILGNRTRSFDSGGNYQHSNCDSSFISSSPCVHHVRWRNDPFPITLSSLLILTGTSHQSSHW